MNKAFKSLVVILALGGVMVSTSCKKNSVNGRVKSTTSTTTGQNPVTTTYSYDGQGRVLTIQDNSGTESYSYGPSTVTVTNVQGQTTIYTLNNQGYAGSDNQGLTYSYDNSGYLTAVAAQGGGSQTSTYQNGDEQTRTIVSNGTTTILFTYLTNTDYRDYGKHFLGKRNSHVLNSVTVTSGNNTTTYTFTYNFDDQGRVVTATQTGNNSITTTTYTY